MEVTVPSLTPGFNFASAPSSPPRFYSAPGSPSSCLPASPSAVPFNWEQKPGVAKDDFEFHFSFNLECHNSLSADELFDGGKIRPLRPPPGFNSPRSPKKSPRHKNRDFDPFAAALEQIQRSEERAHETGGERTFRVLLDQENCSTWHKKWKIKDLLLFRSASDADAHPLTKKGSFFKKTHQDEPSPGSAPRRRTPISVHHLLDSVKRSVEKSRALLPDRQPLLGCLGFHRTVAAIKLGSNNVM